ncbi:hypothetical protein TRSC58_06317 [Trypanosoma rangeli SC58]|uniref:Uncharacterized protein n=1 Tax=Trypanosoma rangeli SC58 TaxID=429131 RepID=A0A061IVA1_TRYRA|nr:hypothetical protein TRSC58_06317 [Trypanosoma rangeli SC58]
MAMAPTHCFEPPLRLYIGVDYRWDPLFFRIPSPRGPTAHASRAAPSEGTYGVPHVVDRRSRRESSYSPDMVPRHPGGALRIQATSDPQLQQRQESGGERRRDSPRAGGGGDVRRDCVSCGPRPDEGVVPSQTAVTPQPRPAPATCPPPTCKRKEGANPATSRRSKASAAIAGRAVLSHPHDHSLVRSPRLTRSAILRREFNASDAPSKQPLGSSLDFTNRVGAAFARTPAEVGGVRMAPTRGEGAAPPSTLLADGAATRHCQDHAWASTLCAASLTPRGTRAAALRLEHVRRKLNVDHVPRGSVARPHHLERTAVAARAGLVVVDGNRHGNVEGMKWRSEIPPIPKLWELTAPRTANQSMRTKGGDPVWDSSHGLDAAATRGWEAKARGRLLRSKAATKEGGVCRDGVDQLSILCDKEGIVFTSTEMNGGGGGAVMPVDKVEEEPEGNALAGDPDACRLRIRAGNPEWVEPPVQSGSCAEEEVAGPCCEGVKLTPVLSVKDNREHTLSPFDMVVSLHEWSSDPFSEDATATPQSLTAAEVEVEGVVSPPSYWRAETLPMVEANAACAAPSAVSLEECLSPSITPGRRGARDAVAALSRTSAWTDDIPLSSCTKRHVAERMASMPPCLLLEYAAAPRRTKMRLTPSTTLRNYKALQRRVRMKAMRTFFYKWIAWIRLRARMGWASVGQADLSTRSRGHQGHVPSAVLMGPAFTLCDETGAAEELHATQQNGQDVVWETLSKELCVTPTQPHVPLKKKSPPPLSVKLLERVVGSNEQTRTTVQDMESTYNSNDSRFASSSLASREEDCVSPQSRSAHAEYEGDWTPTEGTLLDSLRSLTPINCDAQGMKLLPSRMSSASVKSRSILSANDSLGSLELEDVIPAPKRSSQSTA